MTDWQEAYYDLVNKVECECVQQGDLVPIWDQFKRMALTIQKLQGHQGAMEAELAKYKALAETLAGALGPFAEEWDEQEFLAECHWSVYREASNAMREYKEARDD